MTLDFAHKCKEELLSRGVYDFDFDAFDNLSYFNLDPITANDVFRLAQRIRDTHGIVYGWDAEKATDDSTLQRHCKQLMAAERADKVRHAIKSIVGLPDSKLD